MADNSDLSEERRSGLSRRRFLIASIGSAAGLAGMAILQGCSPSEPSPAATTKPAAPTNPTVAPAAAAPTKPAAAATAVPQEAKLGKQLIGKLEGAEILTDPGAVPKKFSEAPMLADLVKAGKLPPVEKRIPEEPMVIKPLKEIGKYGGTWRRAFTGPADLENGGRICSTDRPLFVDYTATKTKPCVAKAWKTSDDGMVFTLYLRKGMKWSDGEPFTADDIMFWYEDLYSNKEIVAIPPTEMFIGGKSGKIEKVDDYTVQFVFPEPYYSFELMMRGDTNIGCGPATGNWKPTNVMGLYAPKHYLKNFLPKYVSKDELDKQAKDANMESWLSLLRFKFNWALNTEVPVLTPWKTTSPVNTTQWILERNPYYHGVDTEGNQLPYWDKIVMTMAENLEVLNLRAIAGEFDWQSRHIQLPKPPVLLENQQKGNYKVYLDPGQFGGSAYLAVNQTYDADPEIAKWLQTVDFRRALSMGIDRDQINEAYFLGLGTPGSTAPDEGLPHSPGKEWRTKWSTLDLKQANDMLDKTGLDKKDGEGYRLRTDGKGRLRLEVATQAAALTDFTGVAEMVVAQWKKIGIQAELKEMERGLEERRSQNNELQIEVSENTGSENLFTNPNHVLPIQTWTRHAPLYGKWYASNGESGKKPSDPEMLRAMELFKANVGAKEADQNKAAQEIWKIHIDGQHCIGTVGLAPGSYGVRVVKNNVGNVPERLSQVRDGRIPCIAHPTTLFFKS